MDRALLSASLGPPSMPVRPGRHRRQPRFLPEYHRIPPIGVDCRTNIEQNGLWQKINLLISLPLPQPAMPDRSSRERLARSMPCRSFPPASREDCPAPSSAALNFSRELPPIHLM